MEICSVHTLFYHFLRLMTTIFYFCVRLLISLIVPFLASETVGGANHSIYEITTYLHNINLETPITNTTDRQCKFLKNSVNGWLSAKQITLESPSLNKHKPTIIFAQLLPVRCNDTFPGGIVTSEFKNLNSINAPNEMEEYLGLTKGVLKEIHYEHISGVETIVYFNLSNTVSLAWVPYISLFQAVDIQLKFLSQYFLYFCHRCFNSFMLQLLLLLLILLSLTFLRRDANLLVIMPLRRLLRIVLRCKFFSCNKTNSIAHFLS